jgi:hypothetical protein
VAGGDPIGPTNSRLSAALGMSKSPFGPGPRLAAEFGEKAMFNVELKVGGFGGHAVVALQALADHCLRSRN